MEVKPYPEVTFDPDSDRGPLIVGRALVELDRHLPVGYSFSITRNSDGYQTVLSLPCGALYLIDPSLCLPGQLERALETARQDYEAELLYQLEGLQ